MEMIFNEMSVSKEQLNIIDANKLFSSFLHTYTNAVKSNFLFSRSLTTPIDFNLLEISSGYFISQWRNSPSIDKDDKIRFLGICERQNISMPSTEDYQLVQHGDIIGKGFQIAYENQRPLISIPSAESWKQHTIQCLLYDVDNESVNQITLKNIYCDESLKTHEEWIRNEIDKEHLKIRTPDMFLSRIPTLFPSLVFHRNALAQIKNQINPVTIPTIVEKLLTLEKYFSVWDGGKFDLSSFPRRFLSPESDETLSRFKKEHTFMFEGDSLLVSYHVRYTGGNIPGRIYIYPQHKQRRCVICSLDTKLPTVTDPKF